MTAASRGLLNGTGTTTFSPDNTITRGMFVPALGRLAGKWYYFYPDGAMAVNTKIDGYEVGPDGDRKEE